LQDTRFATALANCYAGLAKDALQLLKMRQDAHCARRAALDAAVHRISALEATALPLAADGLAASAKAAEPSTAGLSADVSLSEVLEALLEEAAEASAHTAAVEEGAAASTGRGAQLTLCGAGMVPHSPSPSYSRSPTNRLLLRKRAGGGPAVGAVVRDTLPGRLSCSIVAATEKLGYLAVRIAAAHAAREASLVIVSTPAAAHFLVALLSTFTEQQLLDCGRIVAATSPATAATEFDRIDKVPRAPPATVVVDSVAAATPHSLACCRATRVTIADAFDPQAMAAVIAELPLAEAHVLLLPHEALVARLLCRAGAQLPPWPAPLLQLACTQNSGGEPPSLEMVCTPASHFANSLHQSLVCHKWLLGTGANT
jgi:hypothetical protein